VQAAKTKQAIKEEEMQITVIERAQNIQVQEQEIIRRERELDATIRKPAEAEKYRLEKIADANKYEIISLVYYRQAALLYERDLNLETVLFLLPQPQN